MMLNSLSNKFKHKNPLKALTGWDAAISEIQVVIRAERERLRKLKASEKAFRLARDSGEVFPGEKALLGQDSDL
jgi:hypothetical protein